MDSKDLENFRKTWKSEIKEDKIKTHISTSETKTSASGSATSDSNTQKCENSDSVPSSSGYNKHGRNTKTENEEQTLKPKHSPTKHSYTHGQSETETTSKNKNPQLRNEYCSPTTNISESDEHGTKRKNTLQPFLIAENLLEGKSGKDSFESVPDEFEREEFIACRNKRLKLSTNQNPSTSSKKQDSFLDIFLTDLDEINEIPFFDIDLPRELAIKIFRHLDPVDLCRCSQVSKAWKSLSEDELLWSMICHRLGFEEEVCTVDKSLWKERVREHVSKERMLRQNWRTRTGETEPLEFVQGGILCAAANHHYTVAAGYTSGAVSVWDLHKEADYTLSPSQTALVLNERLEAGTIRNMVTHVCVNDRLVAAAYSQGNVDIWTPGGEHKSPVSTFTTGGKSIKSLKCSEAGSFLAAAAEIDLWVCQPTEGCDSEYTAQKLEMPYVITDFSVIPSTARDPVLAVGYYDQVALHSTGRDPGEVVTLHHTMDHRVTCLDATATQLAAGINTDDSFRLTLYDLQTCRECMILTGHTVPITAINARESPQHSLVTGCHDRKVRVYDTRLSAPVIKLSGHCGRVHCVQMDDWKVVSGGDDGMVCAWDQRMAAKMWEQHNRHPVRHVGFKDHFLFTANIPSNKDPEDTDPFDTMYHRRYRGSLHVYNFSVNAVNPDLPSNVYSTYDEPEGYSYNIGLAVPYDNV